MKKFLLFLSLLVLSLGWSAAKAEKAPELVIIPVEAVEKGAPASTSRFLLDVKEGGYLFAIGEQMMILKQHGTIRTISMVGNHWGLGGEHGFLVNIAEWGNGQFTTAITTDRKFPITFKVCKEGYAYLCGRGTIKVKGGKEYRLGHDITEDNWIAGLKSKHQLVREGSCEALGRLGVKKAVPYLLEVLSDPAWEVRRNACETLRLLGDPRASKSLAQLLEDKKEDVRKAAAHALAQIGSGLSKEEVSRFVDNLKRAKDEHRQAELATALRGGGEVAANLLSAALKQAEDESLRKLLQSALSELSKPKPKDAAGAFMFCSVREVSQNK